MVMSILVVVLIDICGGGGDRVICGEGSGDNFCGGDSGGSISCGFVDDCGGDDICGGVHDLCAGPPHHGQPVLYCHNPPL